MSCISQIRYSNLPLEDVVSIFRYEVLIFSFLSISNLHFKEPRETNVCQIIFRLKSNGSFSIVSMRPLEEFKKKKLGKRSFQDMKVKKKRKRKCRCLKMQQQLLILRFLSVKKSEESFLHDNFFRRVDNSGFSRL